MGRRTKGGMWCKRCGPVMGVKNTHKVRNAGSLMGELLLPGATLMGSKVEGYACPNCGGRVHPAWMSRGGQQPTAAPPTHSPPEPGSTGRNARSALDVVIISNVDPHRRIETVEIVWEATGLSMDEAIATVDTCEVIECADEAEAVALKAELERVGATVELSAPSETTDAEPGTSDTTGGMASELERLADLHGRGALSDEEFAAAKSKVLRT